MTGIASDYHPQHLGLFVTETLIFAILKNEQSVPVVLRNLQGNVTWCSHRYWPAATAQEISHIFQRKILIHVPWKLIFLAVKQCRQRHRAFGLLRLPKTHWSHFYGCDSSYTAMMNGSLVGWCGTTCQDVFAKLIVEIQIILDLIPHIGSFLPLVDKSWLLSI